MGGIMTTRFQRVLPIPFTAAMLVLSAGAARATVIDVIVDGSDAIFLAGRTDITIPPPGDPWTTGDHLLRHGAPTPEEIQETLPPFVAVSGGDVVKVADPAVGGVNFFNGFGPPFFGPGGNGLSGSDLTSLGGISGYKGPQGPLTGVFLDNSIPTSGAPPTRLYASVAGRLRLISLLAEGFEGHDLRALPGGALGGAI